MSLFLLVACGGSSDSDLADAMNVSESQSEALADFFNGTSDEKAARAADVASNNTQTMLLVGILGVAILILIVVLVKNKNKKQDKDK